MGNGFVFNSFYSNRSFNVLVPTKTLNAVCIILAVMLFALGIRYLIEYRKKGI